LFGALTIQAKEHGISEEDVVSQIMLKPMPKSTCLRHSLRLTLTAAFISIEEMAGVTEFLMSDVARNITAQAITIDGGWTAR
jgi:3-hydroxybutyrate dehydrogenase